MDVRRLLQRLNPASVLEKGERFALLFFCAQSGTGHFIHGARPRVVIDAIEQVVREAREKETMTDAR
jgi:hypothetical protein